jgi:hypothetical protein
VRVLPCASPQVQLSDTLHTQCSACACLCPTVQRANSAVVQCRHPRVTYPALAPTHPRGSAAPKCSTLPIRCTPTPIAKGRTRGALPCRTVSANSLLAAALPCFNRPVGELLDYQGRDPEQWLAAIGDISISEHWVSTPSGTFPIRGTIWTVTDSSHYQERMHPVGIVLAILFIWFCFLSLLFLLMKEHTLSGYTQVTVQGSGFYHSTLIRAGTLPIVTQQVNYARALAAAA